tara:strand:+ start:11346 stop:12482 length:1137 start_codon:yes stop_codon:yes gene_type:complete
MIGAENEWALWAVMSFLAVAGLVLERTRFGAYLSGAVISILLGIVVSNCGWVPHTSPAYDFVWNWLLLLGIPLLLLEADLRKILKEAGPLLIAFIIGGIGTIAGALVAYGLVPLGAEGWKMASVLTASYIGGSVNYMATAKALELESDSGLLAAGAAADNLAMALFFVILFWLPSCKWIRAWFPERTDGIEDPVDSPLAARSQEAPVTASSLATAVAVSFTICAVGLWAGEYLPFAGSGVLVITILSVAIATLGRRWIGSVRGHRELGMALMQVFFVVIGLSANIGAVLRIAPMLFAFLAILLSVHLAVLLIAGKFCRLDLREIVLASNANCGGPTTAAAMAISKRWNPMVVPIILCGTLGYAGANFVGIGMAWLLGG